MRRDPAAQFWGVILTLGAALLLGGVGILVAVAGETTDTTRWVGVGLIAGGVIVSAVACGGFSNLFFELREKERRAREIRPATFDRPKVTRANITFQPDITLGLATLRIRNDGPTAIIQVQVEGLSGLEPGDKFAKQILKFPYTAPWMTGHDKINDVDWGERRERRLLTGASQTVGLMTAWGERVQLWGVEFPDGHIWAISQARRRKRIRLEVAILGDGPPRREAVEFRRTATGLTLPRDQQHPRTGA